MKATNTNYFRPASIPAPTSVLKKLANNIKPAALYFLSVTFKKVRIKIF